MLAAWYPTEDPHHIASTDIQTNFVSKSRAMKFVGEILRQKVLLVCAWLFHRTISGIQRHIATRVKRSIDEAIIKNNLQWHLSACV